MNTKILLSRDGQRTMELVERRPKAKKKGKQAGVAADIASNAEALADERLRTVASSRLISSSAIVPAVAVASAQQPSPHLQVHGQQMPPGLHGISAARRSTQQLQQQNHHHHHHHHHHHRHGPSCLNVIDSDERAQIRKFWLSLSEVERAKLVILEKEAVLRKMKEQQRHHCSCWVCGKRKTIIEDEMEQLYDAYYQELETYSMAAAANAKSDGAGSIGVTPTGENNFYGYIGGRYFSDGGGDGNDDGLSDYSQQSDHQNDSEADAADDDDQWNLANSLTVKGGLLTLADDFLKNDGRKFIEMMERMNERRLQREADAHSELEMYNDEDDYEDDDESEDEEDEEYYSNEQKMAEGRRMFQLFAARMFEQRVLQAYREKAAEEAREKLLREIAMEEQVAVEREAKKAEQKQRNRDRKRQLKQQKDEERQVKERERLTELARQEEEKRKKTEEERKKRDVKEAERRKREEERLKKDEEERKKAAELERQKKESERKKQEKDERRKKLERELEHKAQQERKARTETEERQRKEERQLATAAAIKRADEKQSTGDLKRSPVTSKVNKLIEHSSPQRIEVVGISDKSLPSTPFSPKHASKSSNAISPNRVPSLPPGLFSLHKSNGGMRSVSADPPLPAPPTLFSNNSGGLMHVTSLLSVEGIDANQLIRPPQPPQPQPPLLAMTTSSPLRTRTKPVPAPIAPPRDRKISTTEGCLPAEPSLSYALFSPSSSAPVTSLLRQPYYQQYQQQQHHQQQLLYQINTHRISGSDHSVHTNYNLFGVGNDLFGNVRQQQPTVNHASNVCNSNDSIAVNNGFNGDLPELPNNSNGYGSRTAVFGVIPPGHDTMMPFGGSLGMSPWQSQPSMQTITHSPTRGVGTMASQLSRSLGFGNGNGLSNDMVPLPNPAAMGFQSAHQSIGMASMHTMMTPTQYNSNSGDIGAGGGVIDLAQNHFGIIGDPNTRRVGEYC